MSWPLRATWVRCIKFGTPPWASMFQTWLPNLNFITCLDLCSLGPLNMKFNALNVVVRHHPRSHQAYRNYPVWPRSSKSQRWQMLEKFGEPASIHSHESFDRCSGHSWRASSHTCINSIQVLAHNKGMTFHHWEVQRSKQNQLIFQDRQEESWGSKLDRVENSETMLYNYLRTTCKLFQIAEAVVELKPKFIEPLSCLDRRIHPWRCVWFSKAQTPAHRYMKCYHIVFHKYNHTCHELEDAFNQTIHEQLHDFCDILNHEVKYNHTNVIHKEHAGEILPNVYERVGLVP